MTIGANLQWTITKTGSVGGSESLMGQWSVTADDLKRQGCALFFYPEHLWRCYDFPLQIQFSLVGEMEQAVSEREEFLDVFVVGQGPSDVVHLRAVVLSARVWKKQNSWDWQRAGGEVERFPVRGMPDGMKLGLDIYVRTFPYGPPDRCGAAAAGNAVFNQREALILGRALHRRALHVEKANVMHAENMPSKVGDIGFNGLGRSHEFEFTGDARIHRAASGGRIGLATGDEHEL